MKSLFKFILRIKPFSKIKSELMLYYASKQYAQISLTKEEQEEIELYINTSFSTSAEARYWYEDFFLKVAERLTGGKEKLLYSLLKHVSWLTYEEYLEFNKINSSLEKSFVMQISDLTQAAVESALQKREREQEAKEQLVNAQSDYHYSQSNEENIKKVIH